MLDKYYFEKRNILIAGATGLIGSHLIKLFNWEGHTIRILSTNKDFVSKNENTFYWNVEEQVIDEKAFQDVEVIVNLAGANIAGGLWTKDRKKEIYDSRVLGTRLINNTLRKLNKNLMFYIGASAIGFYGPNNTNTAKTEDDPPGEGFLAEVCRDWEIEHKKFEELSEHFVIARISNVFAKNGGFVQPFFMLSKYGLKIKLSNHQNYFSWIHIDDVVRFISACLYMDFQGIFNITVKSTPWGELQDFIYSQIGDQVIRITLPKWFLKLSMGEMSSLLVDGNYASGNKLEEVGFMIRHIEPDLVMQHIRGTLPEFMQIDILDKL